MVRISVYTKSENNMNPGPVPPQLQERYTSYILLYCTSIFQNLQLMHMHYDTPRISMTVQSFTVKFYSSQCKRSSTLCESTWSLQLGENVDFNIEEKGSKLIELRNLQPKGRKAEKTF